MQNLLLFATLASSRDRSIWAYCCHPGGLGANWSVLSLKPWALSKGRCHSNVGLAPWALRKAVIKSSADGRWALLKRYFLNMHCSVLFFIIIFLDAFASPFLCHTFVLSAYLHLCYSATLLLCLSSTLRLCYLPEPFVEQMDRVVGGSAPDQVRQSARDPLLVLEVKHELR